MSGRPRSLSPAQAAQVLNLIARGTPKKAIARRYGVSVNTIYRVVYRVREEEKEEKPRILKPCGTNAAYKRHLDMKEEPCTPCRKAHSREQKKFEEKRGAEFVDDLSA